MSTTFSRKDTMLRRIRSDLWRIGTSVWRIGTLHVCTSRQFSYDFVSLALRIFSSIALFPGYHPSNVKWDSPNEGFHQIVSFSLLDWADLAKFPQSRRAGGHWRIDRGFPCMSTTFSRIAAMFWRIRSDLWRIGTSVWRIEADPHTPSPIITIFFRHASTTYSQTSMNFTIICPETHTKLPFHTDFPPNPAPLKQCRLISH
ncbi:hypothetical protein [Falsibacillus pallidus]|uniref:Uncharacterized protein n=1 Tax=Falsibacillus pallidus TaxID=493781 RepID=A0A370GCR9_9BACI|nr:hypothetical protein [Falsibacillus pallidus]RDI41588.1 hypothetical protein DFR59_10741 [Falsibacillus pallidus]